LRLHDNIIEVDLQVAPYLPFEAELLTPLVCGHCVLQSERHFQIAKIVKGADECGGGLVCTGKWYLVITRVGIQET
jgi:hypothetical protein